MSKVLMSTFDQCPNLMSELRVLEMFQGVSRREVVQVKSSYAVYSIKRANTAPTMCKICNLISVSILYFINDIGPC